MKKPHPQTVRKWQRSFEAALPKMRKVIDFRLRHLHGNRRDEAEADTLSLCWQDWLSLCKRGIDPTPWTQKVAEFACLGATSDKLQSVNDLLSRRNGHLVQSLHEAEDGELAPEIAELHDRKAVSPADEAASNVDFQEWLAGLDAKHRNAALQFAEGKTNSQVGATIGLGRGSGSMLRRELRADWQSRNR